MTCKFCGNVIEDNSDICFICGQKVEAAPVAEAPVAPVAPVAEAPVAPVYAAAPAAPVYAAAPAAPAAPVINPADLKAQKKAMKEAKKAAKAAKKKGKGISIGRVIITALIIALVFILKDFAAYVIAVGLVYAIFAYRSYNKVSTAGNTGAANRLVNSLMIGACIGMAVACVLLIAQSFGPADAAAAL